MDVILLLDALQHRQFYFIPSVLDEAGKKSALFNMQQFVKDLFW
jgi:hypothetical protein